MGNDEHTTKLDNVIKDALINYKTIDEVADWARVESALKITPVKTNFNWKATAIVVGLIVITIGGYFLFTFFPFTLSKDKPVVTAPNEVMPASPSKLQTTTPTAIPAFNESVVVNNDSISDSIAIGSDKVASEKALNLKEETTVVTNKNSKDDREKLKNESLETTTKKQTNTKAEINKGDKTSAVLEKNINISKKTDQPNSGADKNKSAVTGNKSEQPATIVSDKTPPVEETVPKEDASKTKSKPIPKAAAPSSTGWNTLMFSNINADSLMKYRERIKKDTVQ